MRQKNKYLLIWVVGWLVGFFGSVLFKEYFVDTGVYLRVLKQFMIVVVRLNT